MAGVRSDEVEELAGRVMTDLRSAEDVGRLWMGGAASEFNSRLAEADGKVRELARGYDRHADALLDYASDVEQIARDAASLRARISANDEELRLLNLRLNAIESDPAAALELQRLEAKLRAAQQEDLGFERAWDALSTRRTQADGALVASLDNPAGADYGTGNGYVADGSYTDQEFMAILSGMTAAQVAALMADDPTFGERLAAVKDAAAVASWWQSLAPAVAEGEVPVPSAIQQQLLEDHPTVFGNLDGIWYGHRHIANVVAFEATWGRMEALGETYFSMVHTYSNSSEYDNDAAAFLAEHGWSEADFVAAYAELAAIDRTLASAPVGGHPPYQFIQYQPGDPTLAAISVGDMDTATQITTNVPGMGTTVTKSLLEWTQTAENVWRQQTGLEQLYDTGEGGLAVVAWIGYDAPDMFPASVQVLSSDNAESGADQLVDFLTGVSATREWDAGANLSVIGHSYGTTTASLALAETPVENFIMLGSAGIDESIPHVSDLEVDPDNVWASEAQGDWIADFGRGELTPWGSTPDPLNAFEHQIDPTNPEYGANVFSSETAVFMGEEYLASDGHESTPYLGAQLDDDVTDDTPYGYLDWGTSPLLVSSMLSLGLTDEVDAVIIPSGGGGSGR